MVCVYCLLVQHITNCLLSSSSPSLHLSSQWLAFATLTIHPLHHNHQPTLSPTSHKEIIKKYPEIQKLYGSDWRPAPIAVALIIGQLALAYHSKNWSNGFFFLVAWVYGGAAAHALSLMTHELSHNLVFASPKANEYVCPSA